MDCKAASPAPIQQNDDKLTLSHFRPFRLAKRQQHFRNQSSVNSKQGLTPHTRVRGGNTQGRSDNFRINSSDSMCPGAISNILLSVDLASDLSPLAN